LKVEIYGCTSYQPAYTIPSGTSINKGLCQALHDMTTACRHVKIEQDYIKASIETVLIPTAL
jgi:hypothetical protein